MSIDSITAEGDDDDSGGQPVGEYPEILDVEGPR